MIPLMPMLTVRRLNISDIQRFPFISIWKNRFHNFDISMSIGIGIEPDYSTEYQIYDNIKKHCKENGVTVDPTEMQKVLDYLGSDPHFICDTAARTVYNTPFRGNHALITFVEGLYGVHLSDAQSTAESVGLTLVTQEQRGRTLCLHNGSVTVSVDGDGCIDGIISYG
jgi:hypothetical protein